MATHTAVYCGQILHIMFETSTDLTPFLPPGLKPIDPHRAFIKAERLKIRSPDADKRPSAFTHYQQICVSTLAVAPSATAFGARHRNMLMWENRHWAIGSTMVASKRYGSIEMTEIYETERTLLIDKGQPTPFHVEVETNGYPLMRFEGVLDGRQRAQRPAYDGFFVGGEPGQPLLALTLDASDFIRPIYGTGSLSFGAAPNEAASEPGAAAWPATLFKDIRVEGCVFNDMTFTRTYGAEFETVEGA